MVRYTQVATTLPAYHLEAMLLSHASSGNADVAEWQSSARSIRPEAIQQTSHLSFLVGSDEATRQSWTR